jgi:hypothetical protein
LTVGQGIQEAIPLPRRTRYVNAVAPGNMHGNLRSIAVCSIAP